jgi:hypothetical protein
VVMTVVSASKVASVTLWSTRKVSWSTSRSPRPTTTTQGRTKGAREGHQVALQGPNGQGRDRLCRYRLRRAALCELGSHQLGARMEVSGSLAAVKKRFVPVPKRWVVERTFAWLSDYRRLDRDHERHMAHSAAMIGWASIKLLLNRLR